MRTLWFLQALTKESDLVVSNDAAISTILDDVCDVLAYSELASKVDSSSDLQAILKENINDACKWVSGYLNAAFWKANHPISALKV